MPAKKRQAVQYTVQHADSVAAWAFWQHIVLHQLSDVRSMANELECGVIVCFAGAFEKGTHDHSHVWMYFSRPLTIRDAKRVVEHQSGFGGCHIELCDASPDENIAYIDGRKKGQTRTVMLSEWFQSRDADNPMPTWEPNAFWYSSGPIPSDDKPKRGSRTDLEAVYQDLKAGMSWSELEETHPIAVIMYQRSLSQMYSQHLQRRELEKLQKQLSTGTLRSWQETVLSKLECQNERQILWSWDTKGGCGKTWLCRYLASVKDYVYLESGPRKDLAYALSVAVEGSTVAGICVDLTRSFGNLDADLVTRLSPILSLAEAVKNGVVYSGKYNSKTIYFHNAKVLIVANFAPSVEDRQKLLSLDRWDVMEIISL
jgi:hypothetical protein